MPNSPETLLVENLATVRRIAGAIGRRGGLRADEIDDWASWVNLRLIEDDYCIVRKFRGDSSFTTYLTVVVAMLFRDYRAKTWGRWRPSAAAVRRGTVAVRLETLVRRDSVPFAQAAETLRTTGETTLSDRELATILSGLPTRDPLRPIDAGPEPLDSLIGSEAPDVLAAAHEDAQTRWETDGVTAEALSAMALEDQVILRMRFWEGSSIADVARALGMEQKPLYRRVERCLKKLRDLLESRGISAERVKALLDNSAA